MKTSESYIIQDWNLFNTLPPAPDRFRMCIWEYARECQDLGDAIEELRNLVKTSFGLRGRAKVAAATYTLVTKEEVAGFKFSYGQLFDLCEKDMEFVEQFQAIQKRIHKIAGRFDWAFLCAADFPTISWRNSDPECPIKCRGQIYREHKASPDAAVVSREKKRGVTLPYSEYDTNDYFENGDMSLINDIQDDLNAIMSHPYSQGHGKAHCFVIPDEFFTLYDPESIAAAFRKKCHLLDKRRLVCNDTATSTMKRTDFERYTKWLGVLRFENTLSVEDQAKVKTMLRHHSTNRDDPKMVVAANAALEFVDSVSSHEMGQKAVEVYRQMFNVPHDSNPRSVR